MQSPAFELIDDMTAIPDGIQLGTSGTTLCVKALRHYDRRWHRRAGVALAFTLLAALAIGKPDLTRYCRVNLTDPSLAVKTMTVFAGYIPQ